ncbi:hypothetical protein ACJJTC_014719 [Scirpophaga incertulas]
MVSIPLKRLCHWGPISALGIIKLITWAMVHLLGMWWPPHASFGGTLNASLFLILASATLYYFLQSLLEGPGFVPLGWKPENEADTKYLQFCTICNGYKAPRSHHCKKCGRCVMKMDHHCPWINCCVGHKNHWYFTKFLFFAVVGCFYASVVSSYYKFIEHFILRSCRSACTSRLTRRGRRGTAARAGRGARAAVAGRAAAGAAGRRPGAGRRARRGRALLLPGAQYPAQPHHDRGVDRDEGGEPARRGRRRALHVPVRPRARRQPRPGDAGGRCDGLHWPLRPGCRQYDLTREQIEQKAEKRLRAVPVKVVRGYSGAWVPLLRFPAASLHVPCTDEARLALAVGQRLRVTRHRRHWLFGELNLTAEAGEVGEAGEIGKVGEAGEAGEAQRAPRGWFPRAAVERSYKDD